VDGLLVVVVVVDGLLVVEGILFVVAEDGDAAHGSGDVVFDDDDGRGGLFCDGFFFLKHGRKRIGMKHGGRNQGSFLL